MKQLTVDQRKVLAEFFANFAVAWLATGIIGPVITKRNLSETGFSLISAVLLVKKEAGK